MKDTPLFVGKNCSAFRNYYDNDAQFSGMRDGRIPSLITVKNGEYKGNVIAAADKASCGADWGFIEIAVRLSEDNGKTFGDIRSVFAPAVRKYPFDGKEFTSAFAIDPLLMEAEDGRIILLFDFYPECKGLHAPKYLERGSGYVKIDGEYALRLYTGKTRLDGRFVRKGKEFTLRKDGFVYDENGIKTRYYVPYKHSSEHAYSTYGDMYYCTGEKPMYIDKAPPCEPQNNAGEDIYVGNIFVSKGKSCYKEGDPLAVRKRTVTDSLGSFLCRETRPAPFRAPMISYILKMESTDAGRTFSCPQDITPFYKEEKDGIFLGVGPGVGITLNGEKYKGRMLAPCYILGKALVLISDDNGQVWRRNKGGFCENIDECQLVEMPDGRVFCFGRPKGGGKIPLSVSSDGGETFRALPSCEPTVPQCQKSVISIPADFILPEGIENDGRFILMSAPTGHNGKDKTRTYGKVFLGRIDGEKVSWLREYDIKDVNKYLEFKEYSDFYAYSCLSILNSSTIGLLYEAYPSGYITYSEFSL